jgi:hypothetical protein
MSSERLIYSGVQKLAMCFLLKAHSLGSLPWAESTVPVSFWIKEKFNKDWLVVVEFHRLQCCLTRQTTSQGSLSWGQWIRAVMVQMAFNLDLESVLVRWLYWSGMRMEGKVVSAVFCDGCFPHFLSLASLFLLGIAFTISSKLGSILSIVTDHQESSLCFVMFDGTLEMWKREGKL